jgi:YD repeat-containing protein
MVWLILLGQTQGCGLEWTLPTNHFDGVNEQGRVSIWEKVGEVDLGGDLKLPLHINFNSGRESTSPYLGQGWILPLLESSFVQADENRFVMIQPDGWTNVFLRRNPNDTTLEGSAGWKGQIKANAIDVWAPCGWHITFTRGHITSLFTPKGRKLEFIYSGSVVTEIREGGSSRLAVELDPSTRRVAALSFDGRRLNTLQDQKPRVQSIKGQSVVGQIDRSLRSIGGSEGSSKSFEFAVNQKIQPTLRVRSKTDSERLFTWDPIKGQIISDNDWTYSITPPSSASANAALGRKNSRAQTEYWFYDSAKGQETLLDLQGRKSVKTWFVSGPLAGLQRSVSEFGPRGAIDHSSRWIYNEKSQLISIRHRDGSSVNYSYDEKGRFLRAVQANLVTWERKYHPDGSLAFEVLNGVILNSRQPNL